MYDLIRMGDNDFNYRGYTITGNCKIGFVCVSPYGKFSPNIYNSILEAVNEIDLDIKGGENND